MTNYPPTQREALGPYKTATVHGSFDSAASAGDLWTRDVDATVAIRLFTAPYDGYVADMSIDALGGNFSAAVFTIQIAGVEDTDGQYNPGAVASAYKVYKPSQVQFAAGQTISVEIDAYTTFRDCSVALGLVYNLANQ